MKTDRKDQVITRDASNNSPSASILSLMGMSLFNPMKIMKLIPNRESDKSELNALFIRSFWIPILFGLNASFLMLLSAWGNDMTGIFYSDRFWSLDFEYGAILIPICLFGGILFPMIFVLINLAINAIFKGEIDFRRLYISASVLLTPIFIGSSIGFFGFPSAGIWHLEDFPVLIVFEVVLGLTFIYWIVMQNLHASDGLEKKKAIIRFCVGLIITLAPVVTAFILILF